MKVFDVQQQFSGYYTASELPEIINSDTAYYISIIGNKSPGTAIFYEKKKAVKDFVEVLQRQFDGTKKAFKSSIVEIFYWYDEQQGFVDIGNFYTTVDLNLLNYRIAVRIPTFITEEDIRLTQDKLRGISFADKFEIFNYTAGKCVQVMHLGSLAGELETLPILQQFATHNRLVKSGMHHEIHLVNFEKGHSQQHLKTILRDPVRPL